MDLGIGDASARQDSMSIARKAHEETTARQDSMSIAGIVSQEDATARQDSMSIARKAHNGETTARQDSMSIAGTVNENHLAIMTDALTGQRYALHDERQETCNVPVNDPLRRTVNNITQHQPVDPMGYANMGYRKAVITIAPFPIRLSMASEGDICLFQSTLHVKEKSKLIQLPTMQATTLQVLFIERNGYSIGKSTPSLAISSIQPCNFSSIEHSVTRLRGRVRISYSTEAQCRGSIPTFQRPRAHARDLMSMAKCQNRKAQDCMPETLQCKAGKGEVLHRMLIYPRISFRSAPQNVIIEAHLAKWKPVRRRNKKTPRKSTGKTDFANFVITWAWFVILYLCTNMSSVVHAINQNMSSRLLRLVHAPIKASVFSNGSRVSSREKP